MRRGRHIPDAELPPRPGIGNGGRKGRLTGALSFTELATLAPTPGVVDVPCPLCSPVHNPQRRVFRLWREREDFIGFACARCGEKGCARSGDRSAAPSRARLATIRREAAERRAAEVSAS